MQFIRVGRISETLKAHVYILGFIACVGDRFWEQLPQCMGRAGCDCGHFYLAFVNISSTRYSVANRDLVAWNEPSKLIRVNELRCCVNV